MSIEVTDVCIVWVRSFSVYIPKELLLERLNIRKTSKPLALKSSNTRLATRFGSHLNMSNGDPGATIVSLEPMRDLLPYSVRGPRPISETSLAGYLPRSET